MARDRFDHSVDQSDVTRLAVQRVEVITGVERRRRWTVREKLTIVAESMADGAVVSEVARRHGISPQQLFGWRAKVRAEIAATQDAEVSEPMFAPAIIEPAAGQRPIADPKPATDTAGTIEIVIGSITVCVRGHVDARVLAAAIKALRGSL
jgi:transposase